MKSQQQKKNSGTLLKCTAYSDWGPYSDDTHNSYGNIPGLHVYQQITGIFYNKPQTHTAGRKSVSSQAHYFGSSPEKLWCHEQTWTLFCVVLHWYLISTTLQSDDNACSPPHAQQWNMRTWGNVKKSSETCCSLWYKSYESGHLSQTMSNAVKSCEDFCRNIYSR